MPRKKKVEEPILEQPLTEATPLPVEEPAELPKKSPTPTKKKKAPPAEKTPSEELPKKASFYSLDTRELDRDLSPAQLREWNDIYASYRSQTPLTGMVIGVDTHSLEMQDESGEWGKMDITCLVLMDFRVKIIIPESEIWHGSSEQYPSYVVRNMIGANIDYVITQIDREAECAVASRRTALGFKRNRFIRDRRRHVGEIVKAGILCVGPKRLIAECGGYDMTLTQRDISYTAIADLRPEYRPGQELDAKITQLDVGAEEVSISIKEVNPNPFDGAEDRHPIGCSRKAVISGSYKGGVFCRLSDGTTVLCSYKPGYFDDEFYIGDSVLIRISEFNFTRKQVYGKIMLNW
ncbi:hypothetical protein LJC32_03725 [Oscillospiraceae bacterium OttesenSCG-928-F05]|nr:hypothetical protein [Oscillospiraceae bacterium OttesenSCG-928-F05]